VGSWDGGWDGSWDTPGRWFATRCGHVQAWVTVLSTCEAHVSLPIRGGIVAMFPAELDRILVDLGILQ
jgi:hypothetical protein